MALPTEDVGGSNLTDSEIAAQLKAQGISINLGIGLALLRDKIYGPQLQEVFSVWKTNKTKALDLLFASKWAKLRPDARDRYLKQLENSDIYKEDLRQFKLRIQRTLKEYGIQAPDDAALEKYFLSGTDDDIIINDALQGFKFEPGKTGGIASERYNRLLAIAKRNGVSEKNLASVLGMDSVDEVLKELQLGESLSNFEQKIRNYAKTAMPDWVRNRIDQGDDLQDIVSPYISTVSDTLEVPWTSVDVTDRYIQDALAKNKTLTELRKDLRRDTRWQYTKQAQEEVSDAVLGVLRDFGFQG
jgi:hypothetical protein